MDIKPQQKAAIESSGKTIVSASAGSGKTFVMIQKLVAAIESGVDLDSVLAVTFTKKAAAQMKDKLRSAIIGRMGNADENERGRLKIQLSKISSASISTIHSFCAKLLRTYFYAVGIDGTFDIISADDAQANDFKARAIDSMFDRYYAEDNADFKLLLSFYRKKRSDAHLKELILDCYEKLRMNENYIGLLDGVADIYTEESFGRIENELGLCLKDKYLTLKRAVKQFADNFPIKHPSYEKVFNEMQDSLEKAADSGIFAPIPNLASSCKAPEDTPEEEEAKEKYKKFRSDISKKYKDIRDGICGEQIEKERFFESGKLAKAFAAVLKQFDAEYAAVKRDENKLDYNDLEHLTLALLADEKVRAETDGKYEFVFVDEYQDVNPVQESIISLVGGNNLFLVGDVKQAIYGFRGSKSQFFAEKFKLFKDGGGNALRLSHNFRSSDGVLDFVNALFSEIMTDASCGIDYKDGHAMLRGGGYPVGFGSSEIHVFGKDEKSESEELGVYSVKSDGRKAGHSAEGLAVLEIVKRELKSQHYVFDKDTEKYKLVDTQPGDICILTRKNNKKANDIVRALTDAGYSVAGAKEADILERPEVKRMVDILSYMDNAGQDIGLVTAALSPLGGLTCDELAAVRIATSGKKGLPFRECCKIYSQSYNNGIALKLENFYKKTEELRSLAEVFSAAEVIDKILEDAGFEALLSSGGGEKLKNIRRLAAEGVGLSVCALLAKLNSGFKIPSPAAASSDSIKIMTMHASKGLEFPVVIIADICAEYKGKETNELPFDGQFGFAHKYFDAAGMVTYDTLLRRLALERGKREELKNELNLFYVACTRAMCRLHIMAKEVKPYDLVKASKAERYCELFDISAYPHEYISGTEFKGGENVTLISSPDPEIKAQIEEKFMREYSFADSVNLPVKSSASAILRLSEEDFCPRSYELFTGEGETGTERGTAYHRFLELCDFSIKNRDGIVEELHKFVVSGRISAGQCELLDIDSLAEILNMPVFGELDGARLFREQEFLCRLPANYILDTAAEDGVLVQGAIDLLAQTRSGFKIIDYKYSHKTDEQLIKTYSRQLALYKKAVALIMHVDEDSISTAIVNIFRRRQITL